MPPPISSSLLAAGVVVLILTLAWLKAQYHDRAFAAARGCEPLRRLGRWANIDEATRARFTRTWLLMWCKRYSTIGTTFQSSSLGYTIMFTVDPENIKAMLSTKFKDFDVGPRRRELLGPLAGTGVFTADGKAWEHSRSLLRPSFTKVRVSDLGRFESHFQDFLAALPPPDPHSGLVDVDLQPLFYRLTLDSATDLVLGRSFHSLLASPDSPARRFMDASEYAIDNIHYHGLQYQTFVRPFAWLRSLIVGKNKSKFHDACKQVHASVDEILDDFLTNLEKPESKAKRSGTPHADESAAGGSLEYQFLKEISSRTKDRVEIRSQVLNVLIAGRDTTANLLSNTFFLLARHPDLWVKMRAEVRDTFGDQPIDYKTLKNIRTISNLLNECLRLYPPVSINSRYAVRNTTLPRGGGADGKSPVFVPAGQSINYHTYAMHRMTDYFGSDAYEFRPDRWNEPDLRIPGWRFIPFGGGPRVCLGQHMAMVEASFVVARALQCVESIERRDTEYEWRGQVGLATKSRRGTKVAMKMASGYGNPTP